MLVSTMYSKTKEVRERAEAVKSFVEIERSRAKKQGTKAFINLSQIDLAGADLAGADLAGTYLRWANLMSSLLENAALNYFQHVERSIPPGMTFP